MTKSKRMSAEERRSQILDVALDVFAKRGFSGARTREVADLAGISETLIYRHFKTKADLYDAALHHLFGGHPMRLELQDPMQRRDDEGVFFQLALHMLSHTAYDPRIVRLHLFQLLDDRVQPVEERHGKDNTLVMLTSYVAERIEDGAFAGEDPECMARLFHYMVYMAVTDIQMGLLGGPYSVDPERMARTMTRTFLNGLRSR
ncbi:TetR/AcrR family transcriptional regulator [Pseudodesulfovibrio senegalensis]|uniref:TetR/AcrR family transcriptional regulator n=1 Tax=Pseudodesulfovibrio senegalensis TaxID=1721087 RepID=A0A6N6N627_9BACT|nr:TetR/AcrR family transcriptional regulator [Pseudodesulfovibrio senegalensis]KAB1443476.1 TetR/AcrR family transcriptional regulator [Pseudodesulfovibrio senegalensis]